MRGRNHVRNGVVKFRGKQRIFGAWNDELKIGLGANPGFRGLFASTSGKKKDLIGISENVWAILEVDRGLF